MRSGQMKITLCLTLLLYTSVRSLDTGYNYETEEHIQNDVLYKDLKCGYLFDGYTNMRVLKLLLEAPYSTEFKLLVGNVYNINNVVKLQITSLIGLNGVRIGAMWLLHLFTGLVVNFYQDSKNPTEDHLKVLETLDYVINKLNADLAGCRKDNSFDWYDSVLEAHTSRTFGLYNYKKSIAIKHLNEAKSQLKKNRIISDDLLKEKLENSTRMQPIFLHNLGRHEKLKYDLQNVYNLQIEWNNTSMILFALWVNARYLDWSNSNLSSIKIYYNACYDYLKIIIFRLTVINMTYLLHYTYKSAPYLLYAQESYNIVVEFGCMLNLSEDLHVKILLDTLGNLTNGTGTIANVNEFLVPTLVTLCQTFGCIATNPFVIDNREFPKQFKSLTKEEVDLLGITISTAWIKYNSLENAKTFLSHLRLAFSAVDFNIIRSLTDYIDELNTRKDVGTSEECTLEMENLHINPSDYD